VPALPSLPRTYRIAKGWRVFIYVFAILLIPLFVWAGLLPFTDEKPFNWGLALLMGLGTRAETKEVSVSQKLYEQVQEGDPVSIYVGKGLLEVPWFVVDKE
jgi:hypothetical protein